MRRLQSRKFCAALVIIAWLATLVSLWGMQDAGRRAVTSEKTCTSKDLRNLGLRLEMASSPDDAMGLLNRDPVKAACLRSGLAAQVRADRLFLIAYSGLVLILFLFVRALWIAPPRERSSVGWGLLGVGLLLAAAMLAGDVIENRHLIQMIEQARSNQPLQAPAFSRLVFAGGLKWGALAASALLLAVSWISQPSRRLVWVLRLLGVAAAALFIAGLVIHDWQIIGAGMAALSAFWLAALIHAVAVAIEPIRSNPLRPSKGTRQP
jgi:hypothetical protein